MAFCAGKQILSGHAGLGLHLEVYDAEAEALCKGLSAATSHPLSIYMESLYACLDNQAVIAGFRQHPKGTSAATLQKCKDYVEIWNNRSRSQPSTCLEPGAAFVLWIPGHSGILGNKLANKEASCGAHLPLELHAKQMSTAGAKQWAHITANRDFITYRNSQPAHCRLRPDCACLQLHAELQLPRESLARLLAALSGHGNFAAYHTRFNHPDAKNCCHCGAYKTPTHFYYCRRSTHKELMKDKHGHLLTIKEILETAEGAAAFSQWEEISGFFKTAGQLELASHR